MILEQLSISSLRNLRAVDLSLGPRFNVLYGDNGAGKTSVLEAIHLLSHGRSFKSRNPAHLIRRGASELLIRGQLTDADGRWRVAVLRSAEQMRLRLNGRDVSRPSEIAARLPVLVIHPGSFGLLVGSRGERRAFLDWGVFYQQPAFRGLWRRFNKLLKQRNAALREGLSARWVDCWDGPLAEAGEEIGRLRRAYLASVVELAPAILGRFDPALELSIRYLSGWAADKPLLTQLQEMKPSDRARGFTQAGPQRGGFSVQLDGQPIAEVASRGQLKLATIAFKLAQIEVFSRSVGRGCLLLLDDLDAELDQRNFSIFLELVGSLGVQVVSTTLHPEKFDRWKAEEKQLFHVEHGEIEAVV